MGDQSINVETGGLNHFARDVRSHAGEFQPAVTRATQSMQGGVAFGATSASGAVYAAKERYAQSLGVSMANLQEYVRAAKIMADAAEKVAAEFDAVDARSAQAVNTVKKLLVTAVAEVDAAQQAANRASYQQGPVQREDVR
jgi:hypothetical protein